MKKNYFNKSDNTTLVLKITKFTPFEHKEANGKRKVKGERWHKVPYSSFKKFSVFTFPTKILKNQDET